MKILFLSAWFPYPADNGSRIRVFNLVKALSRRHEVTLVSFTREPMTDGRLAEMRAYCNEVYAVAYREFNPTRLKALTGFLSPRPRYLVDSYSAEMETLVGRVSRDMTFDVVIASQMGVALYALALDRVPRVFEEVELGVFHEEFVAQDNLFLKARYGLTWWKLSRFLARLLPQFEACTVVSEPERELIAETVPGYTALHVVPNGVDLEANSGDFGAPEPDTLIYTGALTYHANFDAMDLFLCEIFPLVKAERPHVRLRITGGYDGVPVERLPLGDGVELTGYLSDIRPAVSRSWACVVPLRVGGGTRLKILEAMALGTPVVSTTKGADGLGVKPGENILIADTPEAFARAILRLLDAPDLRTRLAAQGRRLVESTYGWESIGQRLDDLVREVVDSGRGRS